MITDALLSFAGWLAGVVGGILPDGHLSLPAVGGVTTWIAKVDSLVPVTGVLSVALGVLAAVVLFVTVRLVLVVWNLVWP